MAVKMWPNWLLMFKIIYNSSGRRGASDASISLPVPYNSYISSYPFTRGAAAPLCQISCSPYLGVNKSTLTRFSTLSRRYLKHPYDHSVKIAVQPVKVYHNLEKERAIIREHNEGRSGIYRWVNLINGKSYIGSSSQLFARFKNYLSPGYISATNNKSTIHKALLKYGYSNFRLEVIEYCSKEELLQKENFYFSIFNPEYNILEIAGSNSGFKHDADTKELMRNARLGKKLSPEHITKMRLSVATSKRILLTNMTTGEVISFSSQNQVAKHLGISAITVGIHLKENRVFKNYTFTLISSSNSLGDKLPIKRTQSVTVTHKDTGESQEFYSISDAAKWLEVSNRALYVYFKLKDNSDGGNDIHDIKGYIISKTDHSSNPPRISKSAQAIQVTNVETNEVTIYPSRTLAGEALGIGKKIISNYFSQKQTTPYKKKFFFKKIF